MTLFEELKWRGLIKDIENVFSVDLSKKYLTLSQIKKIFN